MQWPIAKLNPTVLFLIHRNKFSKNHLRPLFHWDIACKSVDDGLAKPPTPKAQLKHQSRSSLRLEHPQSYPKIHSTVGCISCFAKQGEVLLLELYLKASGARRAGVTLMGARFGAKPGTLLWDFPEAAGAFFRKSGF